MVFRKATYNYTIHKYTNMFLQTKEWPKNFDELSWGVP